MILHWLQLDPSLSIYEQLLIEEALLRGDERNFCIVSEGSSPSIVMGISGKVHELIDEDKANTLTIPIIKRFSGGGTVVVDENTLFVTFIIQKSDVSIPAYPEKIMKWSEEIYKPVFNTPHFSLKENDYVFYDKKFGGNAQYIRKERWLHHTSFLWDYEKEKMQTLLHPKKTPSYREGRDHDSFLCKMKEFMPNKELFFSLLKEHLSRTYTLKEILPEHLILKEDHRSSTKILF
jgi:lipoate-protein ligase A